MVTTSRLSLTGLGRYLVAVRMRTVVNQHRCAEVSAQHRQVLQVVPLHLQTGLAEQAVVHQGSFHVNEVKQLVRVYLLGRGKNNDLR